MYRLGQNCTFSIHHIDATVQAKMKLFSPKRSRSCGNKDSKAVSRRSSIFLVNYLNLFLYPLLPTVSVMSFSL